MINLPELFVQFKTTCGVIKHLIEPSGTWNIVTTETIKVSSRLSAQVFTIENGQRIISTTRKKIVCPNGIDGILYTEEGKQAVWIFHRSKERFLQNVRNSGLREISAQLHKSWINKFLYTSEERDDSGELITMGLRPPQIGGLHAIGAHWSLSTSPATIVMPTGTGKTETMLSALIAYRPGRVLVIVPSKVLRDQTANKFIKLGLLRKLGNVGVEISNPIVGVLTGRPKNTEDLEIFEKCNVVVSTMSALTSTETLALAPEIASRVDALVVDEAHHVAADTWSTFREAFTGRKVLQFTATPFRRDGKLVDGKVVFSYPLHNAQQDGYFKKIHFFPVVEIDDEEGDRAIANLAVEKLREDIAAGSDHLLMARCENITRASQVIGIYNRIASEFRPVLIHSESLDVSRSLARLWSRESRIVVCVNMLGEGFDLPQLKIAAVHDTHKSLAILLQFTGRFTRTAADNIGEAKVIANIGNQDVSTALERLYSEDADWNQLLSEFSSNAARTHARLIEFLNSSRKIGEHVDSDELQISNHLLRPTLTTLVYEAESFTPTEFFTGLPIDMKPAGVWLHEESNTLYFVTKTDFRIKWTRSREIKDRQWDLFILHYNPTQRLLYVSSSNKDSNFESLANAVGASRLKSGEVIFRILGGINRLIFQNVGVKKHGRRNLSYAMYTGADVANALSITERGGSEKSNLSGLGWEDGMVVTIGCSIKGRVWSRDVVSVPELIEWLEKIGTKILDDTIRTEDIIENVLIPQEVDQLPNKTIINIDWPLEILRQSEEKVVIIHNGIERPIYLSELKLVELRPVVNEVEISIVAMGDILLGHLVLNVGGDRGFSVTQTEGTEIVIRSGRLEMAIAEYFSSYPPIIRFVDMSELDGNLLVSPRSTEELEFPTEQFTAWNWTGVDIQKESYWKNGVSRQDSIQWRAIETFRTQNFDVIFDDDSAGEAADIVCIKENDDNIRLLLVHCKYSGSDVPGERVKDVVEVCSQAIRSAKWKWKFKDLCKHIVARDRRLNVVDRPDRFVIGTSQTLNKLLRVSKFKEVKAEVIIVQPGISIANRTVDQVSVLAATFSYLKETIGVDLEVICSE